MITKACKLSTSVRNTGVDCDINMGPTAMFVLVDRNFELTDNDLTGGFLTTVRERIHGVGGTRIYPLFGSSAPIRALNNNKEADVIATLDDGVQIFVRYGFLNRVFSTTNGGLCYAKALQSFNGTAFRVLEFDKQRHMMLRDNRNGTYGGIRTDFMFSPSPDPADFRNPWKTHFQISFDPQEYIGNGTIFTLGDEEATVLDEMGLVDVGYELISASTSHILLRVVGDCSGDNLVTVFGADLNGAAKWSIIDKATGTTPTVTGVTVAGGDHIDIAGTFTTGHTYIIKGQSSDAWYAIDVIGYDFASLPIDVTIP